MDCANLLQVKISIPPCVSPTNLSKILKKISNSDTVSELNYVRLLMRLKYLLKHQSG